MAAFNPFRRTRAAVEHLLRQPVDEQKHLRALDLLRALNACESAWSGRPAQLEGHLTDVRAATRALLGPRWADEHAHEPEIAALDDLETAAATELDAALAEVVRRRFTSPDSAQAPSPTPTQPQNATEGEVRPCPQGRTSVIGAGPGSAPGRACNPEAPPHLGSRDQARRRSASAVKSTS